MFDTPKSFDLSEDEGLMDKTFSLRLPRKVEHKLKEMHQKGIKVGPKLRPHITEMVETLYESYIGQKSS